MSNENKLREELKAQAAEAIDALSLEELKTVSGGVYSDGGYTCPRCGKTFASGGTYAWLVYSAHVASHGPVTNSDTDNP